jgi:TonB family protein
MRRILLATVLTSPFVFTAAALATQPVSDTTASTPTRALSTGVKPAQVLYTPNIDFTPAALESMPNGAEVVLKLNVDEQGLAQDVQVVKSPNHYLDEAVAASVRNYRFRPATLDNQPVALPLTLTVVVQH